MLNPRKQVRGSPSIIIPTRENIKPQIPIHSFEWIINNADLISWMSNKMRSFVFVTGKRNNLQAKKPGPTERQDLHVRKI